MAGTYYAFMPVRNCYSHIGQVLDSLLEQDHPPSLVIAVDDGSTDGTSDILAEYKTNNPDKIKIITTNSKSRDYSRLPSLWNRCLQRNYDYHMISAGDVIYPKDYAANIVREMDKDPHIAVASGLIVSENIRTVPSGAGRFVRQSFFYDHYEKYPTIVGYESEILFRIRIFGYKLTVIERAQFDHVDTLGHKHNFVEFGYGMRALGYHPLFALRRVLMSVFGRGDLSPRGGLYMLWHYLTYRPQKSGYYSRFPIEFRRQVRALQAQAIYQRIHKIFRSQSLRGGGAQIPTKIRYLCVREAVCRT